MPNDAATDLVLVDFDDTLVDTAPRFERARRRLFDHLAGLGFDRDRVEHVHHHEVVAGMRRAHGLGPPRRPAEILLSSPTGWCRQSLGS